MRLRAAIAVLSGVLVTTAPPLPAGAQTYPDRPVQVLIGWTAGASVDVMGRAVAEEMGRTLGQPFVVVNRTGASGTIAFTAVARAAPDGYTLAAGPTTSINVAGHAMKSAPFDIDAFEYVCQTMLNDFTIYVRHGSPFQTIPDLLAALRAAPGKLTYGHLGPASIPGLAIAEFLQSSGTTAVGVAFRGDADVIPAMLAGTLDFASSSILSVTPHAGQLRVLAVFGDKRSRALPDLPTLGERGVRMSPNRGINGFMAPKGTPAPVLQRLRTACAGAMRSDRVQEVARKVGGGEDYLDAAEFAAAVRADYVAKGEIIRRLNIEAN